MKNELYKRRHDKMQRLIKLYMIILVSVLFVNNIWAESSDDVYIVGVNDVLQIAVVDHPELSLITSVSSDGTITFPYIGVVHVKGRKISEIQDDIKKRLSDGYVNYPVVTVWLAKSMSRKIFTYGEFSQRGVIAFEDNMTLLNALSLAGGVSKDGLYGKLTVRRKRGGKVGYEDIIETDLNNGLIENKKIRDTIVQLDDILIIERSDTCLIQGEVLNHGRFTLEKGMTVLSALLQAGGASKDGLYGTLKVRRKKEGPSGDYKDLVESRLNEGIIEDPVVENTLLQPDDILIVERNKTFLIQGEVLNHGRFTLEKGMTVLSALLQAGGASRDGLYGTLKVRRKTEGPSDDYTDLVESRLNEGIIEDPVVENTLLQPDDILIIERNKTFLIQGEAVNHGRFTLEKGMTALSALLQAGGTSKDGLYGTLKVRRKMEGPSDDYKDLVESRLNEGIIEDPVVENTLLQPDDILIVERNDSYFVYGEVLQPGEYVLKRNITTFEAITLAGGFSKWGSANRVKIIRQAGNESAIEIIKVRIDDVISGDINADVTLKAGDKIIISAGVL